MTVMEAIHERRSIRSYDPRPIEPEKLEAVLEAARLAPSARNRQMWKFIVVTDPTVKAQMADACYNQISVKQAPALIAVCGEVPGIMTCGMPEEVIDTSIAMSFILLKAWEEGLGTCWLGYFNQEKAKIALNVPEDVSVVAVTPIGYPAEIPEYRSRKKYEDVVRYDAYQ